jgi:hypothetical protein
MSGNGSSNGSSNGGGNGGGNGGSNGGGNGGRRVVVTGIGAITPIGVGVEGLWDGLRRRRSAVRLFRECDRIARRAVVVADLRRGRLGPLVWWVGARALRFTPVTVADGSTSLRRGFTADELGRLLREAGVRATIERRLGYRLVATWRPEPA